LPPLREWNAWNSCKFDDRANLFLRACWRRGGESLRRPTTHSSTP
jgi:hypothetical protein